MRVIGLVFFPVLLCMRAHVRVFFLSRCSFCLIIIMFLAAVSSFPLCIFSFSLSFTSQHMRAWPLVLSILMTVVANNDRVLVPVAFKSVEFIGSEFLVNLPIGMRVYLLLIFYKSCEKRVCANL